MTEKSETKLRRIELLAPAKNAEVGRVAIDAGADAVYIGGPSFGARKAAGNSLADIAGLCRYAHFFGAKVLVTLNTLLKERELSEAVELAYAYRRIGVDAIIVQDLRLAQRLLGTGDFSGEDGGIRLHASTQCDNRDAARVAALASMGFKRVVLARELSYAEMAAIHEATSGIGVELEAFVHGALCVSYSGSCYLSAAVCGRSANRGECAQMCRLRYDVLDENGVELLHQKHVLSLKDLDRSGSLRQLLATGVSTLKIEGRLKDADYVRNVVAYYRGQLDRLFAEMPERYCRASVGVVRVGFTPNPEKTFHRGATAYFAMERPGQLVNMDTPKSTGELIGVAPLSAQAVGRLHNGDGLTFSDEGFYWPNNRVRIPHGVAVYRNYDAAFQKQLEQKDATVRVLPVVVRLREELDGFAVEMSVADEPQKSVSVRVPMAKETASNGERAEAVVRQQLSKLGGTRMEAREVEVDWTQPYFLSASMINELRRQAVEALTERLEQPHAYAKEKREEKVGLREGALPRQVMDEEGIAKGDLMTCKYCVLHELGCCKKKEPKKTGVPTFLRGQNGLLLRIHTHCKDCYMTLEKC